MWSTTSTKWAITYTNKKQVTYYLVDLDDTSTKIVWSTKKERAKGFPSLGEAEKCVEAIQKVRSNKKKDLKITQV